MCFKYLYNYFLNQYTFKYIVKFCLKFQVHEWNISLYYLLKILIFNTLQGEMFIKNFKTVFFCERLSTLMSVCKFMSVRICLYVMYNSLSEFYSYYKSFN